MATRGNMRGLSRVDALVLATVCLLLILLVPVLFGKPRERASRILCGANLARIGKAIRIYANDYEDELPHAGGRYSTWGPLANWTAVNRSMAYGVNPVTGDGGLATFSSCFYLLVKYCGAPPRLFICQGDIGAEEFRLSDVPAGAISASTQFSDLWDFGPTIADATRGCSYSYHAPFGPYALSTASDPNSPMAADRNPWINSPGADARPFPGSGTDLFRPDIQGYGGSAAQARNGNAITHRSDGQNVLFLDGRVTFETRPYCGIGQDNIYTMSDRSSEGSVFGMPPVSSSQPMSRKDALLLHDDYRGVGRDVPGRTR
jgi:hypothetical protein